MDFEPPFKIKIKPASSISIWDCLMEFEEKPRDILRDILKDEIDEYAKSLFNPLFNHLKSGKYKDAIKILQSIKNIRIEELGPKVKGAKYSIIKFLKERCSSEEISESCAWSIYKDKDFCKIYNSIIKKTMRPPICLMNS